MITPLGAQEGAFELVVRAENWLDALRAGRKELNEDGGLPQGASVVMSAAGEVTILDAPNRRRYLLKRMREEGARGERRTPLPTRAPLSSPPPKVTVRRNGQKPDDVVDADARAGARERSDVDAQAGARERDDAVATPPTRAKQTLAYSPQRAEAFRREYEASRALAAPPPAAIAGFVEARGPAPQPTTIEAGGTAREADAELRSALHPTSGPADLASEQQNASVLGGEQTREAASLPRPSFHATPPIDSPVGRSLAEAAPRESQPRVRESWPLRATPPVGTPVQEPRSARESWPPGAPSFPGTPVPLPRGLFEGTPLLEPPRPATPFPGVPKFEPPRPATPFPGVPRVEPGRVSTPFPGVPKALESSRPSTPVLGVPKALESSRPSTPILGVPKALDPSHPNTPIPGVPRALEPSHPNAPFPDLPKVEPSSRPAGAFERPAELEPPLRRDPLIRLTARDLEPDAQSPLTYRERAYLLASPSDRERLELLLEGELSQIKRELADRPRGQFVSLAVFEEPFQGAPDRAPLATLEWKDWRGNPIFALTSAPPESAEPSPGTNGTPLHSMRSNGHVARGTVESAPEAPVVTRLEPEPLPPAPSLLALSASLAPAGPSLPPPSLPPPPPALAALTVEPVRTPPAEALDREPVPTQAPDFAPTELPAEADGRLATAFEAMPDLYFLPTPVAGLEFSIQLLSRLLPCEAISTCLYDINTDEFRFVALTGPGAFERRAGAVPSSSGLFGVAKRDRSTEVLLIGEVAEEPRYDLQVDGRVGLSARTLAYVPVRNAGQILGMLQLMNREDERGFNQADVAILSYVGKQLGEFLAEKRALVE